MSISQKYTSNNPVPVLYMIVPCYNEEEVLPITCTIFLDKVKALISLKAISDDSRIMFVNDGSKDATWNIIKQLSKECKYYIGISQSRNRGHQNSVLAGLMEAKDKCDITISIDCDGQDDINAIDEMIEKYRINGFEVIYGVRNKRDTDSFFKRFTAESFYKLLNYMGVEAVYNHADYRLMSSRVLQEFEKFKEVNLFLRGMVPLVGFPSTQVYYERHVRIAGESHYPLKKMLSLAWDGITSLSVKPIRIISKLFREELIYTLNVVKSVVEKLNHKFIATVSVFVVLELYFVLLNKSWDKLKIIIQFLFSILIISLYLILFCAKAGGWYISRTDVFYGVFFFGMMIVLICFMEILKYLENIKLIIPLALIIIFFDCDIRGNTYLESNIKQLEPETVYAINNDILNQMLYVQKYELDTMDLYVPVFDSSSKDNWPYATYATHMSESLYKLGVLDYHIKISSIIPTEEKNHELHVN